MLYRWQHGERPLLCLPPWKLTPHTVSACLVFYFIQRGGKGSSSDATCATPPRLMTARKLMAGHAARLAAEQLQEGKATPNEKQSHVTTLKSFCNTVGPGKFYRRWPVSRTEPRGIYLRFFFLVEQVF